MEEENTQLWAQDFGRRLREVLKKNKVTQRELARQLGESPVTLNRYIKGRRLPTVLFLLKLMARFPETDLNWLLRGWPLRDSNEKNNPCGG